MVRCLIASLIDARCYFDWFHPRCTDNVNSFKKRIYIYIYCLCCWHFTCFSLCWRRPRSRKSVTLEIWLLVAANVDGAANCEDCTLVEADWSKFPVHVPGGRTRRIDWNRGNTSVTSFTKRKARKERQKTLRQRAASKRTPSIKTMYDRTPR